MLKNDYPSLVGCLWELFWMQQRQYGKPSSSTYLVRFGFEKLKYYPVLSLNTCQMGWEWWNSEKINWFLSFWVYGVKEMLVFTIRSGIFKPTFMRFLAAYSGTKKRCIVSINFNFCFKISLLVMKSRLECI